MKASTWLAFTAGTVFALGVGFYSGAMYGEKIAYRMVRTQVKVDTQIALEKQNKQMFEYLKARYYYFSNRSGIRLRENEGDFGPVNEALLKDFSAGKGPTTFKEEYEDYRRLLNKP